MNSPITGTALDQTSGPPAVTPTPQFVIVPKPVPNLFPTPGPAYSVNLSEAAQALGLNVQGESGSEVAAILGVT